MTGVLQTILSVIDFDMRPAEAVSEPRFDCQGEIVDVEGRIPNYVCDELRVRGRVVEKTVGSYWPFPLVHAILIDSEHGRIFGGADPRAGGVALTVL